LTPVINAILFINIFMCISISTNKQSLPALLWKICGWYKDCQQNFIL